MTPARRATMYAIPAAIAAALLTFWLISRNLSSVGDDTGPLTSVTVQEVDGTDEQCAFLIDGLPEAIDGQGQRAVTGHPGALAYGDPPAVIVCGVERPAELDAAPQLLVVNQVNWLVDENVDTSAYGLPGSNTLWTAVDREIYIAVAVPADIAGSVVLSPVSDVIAERFGSVEAPPAPTAPTETTATPSPGG